MKNSKTRGFSVTGVVLVGVVLAVLSIAGFYIYNAPEKSPTTINNQQQLPPTTMQESQQLATSKVPTPQSKKEEIPVAPETKPILQPPPQAKKETPLMPGSTCLSNYAFNPIPNNELTENIVFAINEEYAASHPEWQQRAQEVVDYINNVLSKNTQKRYKITKFLTYPTSKYSTLLSDSNYYLSNGNYGGTTFFYYVYDQKSGVPTIVSDTGLVNVSSKSVVNGQTFYSLWLVVGDALHILMGKSLLNQKTDNETYDRFMTLPLHELGHTLGLAYGEWYNYDFTDRTNMLPILGKYRFRDIYPYDPMTTSEKFPYKFSGLNEALINLNANHQYTFEDIAKMHATKAIVRVKNAVGSPVSGATVKVFGAKKNAFYIKDNSQPLLQSLQTDSNGMVEIDNIDSNFQMYDSPTVGWLAKIVKVSKDGKSNGAIFTLVDSQISCIINKSQTHYIDIKIN